MSGKPDAEIDISPGLVEALVAEQYPQLAGHAIELLTSGWDNAIYKLGPAHLVRLPRRAMAAELILHEQRWLPQLAPLLPIATPAPVFCGRPNDSYPWHWSVCPWFAGTPAHNVPLHAEVPDLLAQFLGSLHQPAPADAPHNPYRGVPLGQRRGALQTRIDRVKAQTDLITPRIERLWHAGLRLPPHAVNKWIHGDLHSLNMITRHGTLIAIIDWGDLTAGDTAYDLQVAWGVLAEEEHRARFLASYAPDAETLARAAAWAVAYAAILVDAGLTNAPMHAEQGQHILRRLAHDARPGGLLTLGAYALP